MIRLRHSVTGVVVRVPAEKEGRLPGYSRVDDSPQEPAAGGYDGMKLSELKAEIAARNEGRDADARIHTSGSKADLIAALLADDGS